MAVAALTVVRLFGGPLALASPPVAILATGAALLVGIPTFVGGLRPLLGLRPPEIDTLITTATFASLLLGEAVTGLVVVWLIALGELVEELTLQRTRRAIADLLSVGEEWVWVEVGASGGATAGARTGRRGGREVRVRREEVQPGAVVVVHAGDKIPVDGEVLGGAAAVNQAPITGESLPVFRNPGDEVYAGTLVESGSLRVRAARVGADTAIGRIIRLVEEAREVQAPIQTLADRFARRTVPLSFLLAGGVLAAHRERAARHDRAGDRLPLRRRAGHAHRGQRGHRQRRPAGDPDQGRALPGEGRGPGRRGLRQDGHADRRGPARDPRPGHGGRAYTPERVLAVAASGELHSQHPLASAVLRHTAERELEIPPHSEYEIIVGHGVRFAVDGTRLVIGSQHMLDDYAVPVPPGVEGRARRIRETGETLLWVAEAPQAAGPPAEHAVRRHPEGDEAGQAVPPPASEPASLDAAAGPASELAREAEQAETIAGAGAAPAGGRAGAGGGADRGGGRRPPGGRAGPGLPAGGGGGRRST